MCLDSDRWERIFFGDQNLSRQPWEPQVSCFCFLGLWTLGGRRLLKIFEGCLNTDILCVNGFQLFSLLIMLMWIDHLYKDVCLSTGKPRHLQDSKTGFLMGNFQPHDRLVEKCLVTQIIIPASNPTLCHFYWAKPEEISMTVLCFPYLRISSPLLE